MNAKKTLLNFTLLFLGIAFLWHFYKGFAWHELIEGLRRCKFSWIVLATIMHLFTHALRGYRWALVINAKKKNTYLFSLYCVLAEMTGFFSSLLIPKVGEMTRCSALRGTAHVPIRIAFPAVIVERIIDIFIFIVIFLTVFILSSLWQQEVGQSLFSHLFNGVVHLSFFSVSSLSKLLGMFMLVVVGLLAFYKLFRKQFSYALEFFVALFHVVKKTLLRTRPMTWIVTFCIWGSYFLVEYISCFALEETSQLSFFAVLYLFLVINLGMAIPMPGHIGAYHVLMYSAIRVFKVGHEPAMVYVTITHGIQVFNALVVGGGCAIASWLISRRVGDKGGGSVKGA